MPQMPPVVLYLQMSHQTSSRDPTMSGGMRSRWAICKQHANQALSDHIELSGANGSSA